VVFYRNVELQAERRKNSGLANEVRVILIRHLKKTRMETAIMAQLTLQTLQPLLQKSLYPLIGILTAHPHCSSNVGDCRPISEQ
jgi:hypothetical protein